ncbi:hypothetical protein HN865_00340 [Candidatus Woesearchaeota archaeon]|nr:hypothetical protein [Candidatus Woesearchaeota archaeon]MBT7237289.1 hypothetical protein [Candidatus Woesearchaeota archaeon]
MDIEKNIKDMGLGGLVKAMCIVHTDINDGTLNKNSPFPRDYPLAQFIDTDRYSIVGTYIQEIVCELDRREQDYLINKPE